MLRCASTLCLFQPPMSLFKISDYSYAALICAAASGHYICKITVNVVYTTDFLHPSLSTPAIPEAIYTVKNGIQIHHSWVVHSEVSVAICPCDVHMDPIFYPR